MKRRAWTILLFLLLGAILNVAVAWGCGAWLKPQYFFWYTQDKGFETPGDRTEWTSFLDEGIEWRAGNKFLDDEIEWWAGNKLDGLPPRPNFVGVDKCRGYIRTWMGDSRPYTRHPEDIPGHEVTHSRAGWPILTVEAASWFNMTVSPPSRIDYGWINILPGNQWFGWTMSSPLWPGFIFNTLFYAMTFWLSYQGLHLLRRHRRIRHGRCGQCDYIVAPNIGVPGASPNCPECGTPLPDKPITASPE